MNTFPAIVAMLSTVEQYDLWVVGVVLFLALVYGAAKLVGVMKAAFLGFELALTLLWFWAAAWQFGIRNEPTSDGGTIIGALLFLAFGIGTAWMLCHEIITTARNQFGIELNLLRRYHVMERLAARMTATAVVPQEAPFDLPPEE
jgi:hypothetical protein